MPKAKSKKQIKVRDLKPTKDAKGGVSYSKPDLNKSDLNKNFLGATPH